MITSEYLAAAGAKPFRIEGLRGLLCRIGDSLRMLAMASPVILACVTMGGCANRLKCDVAPDFVGKHTAVARLGITGGGTSAAIPAFQKAGYQVVDLGSGADPVERAASKQIPFVALVEKVGTDGAWWDGFFDFSMRVTETQSEKIVWSASAEYGQGGVFINQTKSTEEAMRAMVADFAKHFPPGVPLPAAPDGKAPPADTGGPLKPLEVK
jgi:hypothetical protein